MKTITIAIALLMFGCGSDWQKAEQAAKQYSKKIKGATGEVDCVHKDSDGDGYCSCSIFMEEGGPTGVECGCEKFCFIDCAEGCKPMHQLKARGR